MQSSLFNTDAMSSLAYFVKWKKKIFYACSPHTKVLLNDMAIQTIPSPRYELQP